jgi:hypothetical protein
VFVKSGPEGVQVDSSLLKLFDKSMPTKETLKQITGKICGMLSQGGQRQGWRA